MLVKYQHYGRAEWLGGVAGGAIGGLAIWVALSLLKHRGLEPSLALLAMFLVVIAGSVVLASKCAGVIWRRVSYVRQQG